MFFCFSLVNQKILKVDKNLGYFFMFLGMEKFFYIYEKLSSLRNQGIERSLPPCFSSYNVSRGTTDGKEVLIFCSNDYLGMTKRKEVQEELKRGIDMYGNGSGASRLVSGNFLPHVEFEDFIIGSFGLKDKGVLAFNSGWSANVGVISALCDENSEIFSDELNHASIIDGCRLSKAKVTVFPHLDLNYLEDSLKKSTAKFKMIVTDSVFSMDGDIAPLGELKFLSDRYGAVLYVDEAHAFGVFGKQGKGLQEFLGIDADISLYTLSKAVGLYGAFVVAPKEVINYIRSRARSFIFSTALPPYIFKAAITSIGIIVNSPELRAKLFENVNFLLSEIKKIKEGVRTDSQIIPYIIGDEFEALRVGRRLFEEGVFVQPIRYPSVPRGTARLRITVSAVHTKEDILRFVNTLYKVSRETKNGR